MFQHPYYQLQHHNVSTPILPITIPQCFNTRITNYNTTMFQHPYYQLQYHNVEMYCSVGNAFLSLVWFDLIIKVIFTSVNMLFKSVYRSYTPICYYVCIFLYHDVYADIWFLYGPEIKTILFYSIILYSYLWMLRRPKEGNTQLWNNSWWSRPVTCLGVLLWHAYWV